MYVTRLNASGCLVSTMPATRAATQRAEVKRVTLLAAASNADTEPLNPELLQIVVKRLPRSQLASARLVSKEFAAAVDPLINTIFISLKSWDGRVAPLVGLQHVTRLGSEVNGAAQWRQLQHITSQLPKLNTLGPLSYDTCIPGAFAASLSSLASLTRLDIQSGPTSHAGNLFPQGVQLPGLRAASFTMCRDLEDIVSFAPNLEQLYCDSLNILDSPAALLACTHFGGNSLYITSKIAAAKAFAAAFPNLQMVTYMPHALHRASAYSIRGHLRAIIPFRGPSAQQLLARLPPLRAVRGDVRRLPYLAMPAAGPLALPQLQRLCLHAQNVLDIPFTSSMSQLQHVRITFEAADETTSQALLRALASLPQLQSLVLPAGLLCSQCCPGVPSSLAALTAKSSLKQLVFMEWWVPADGRFVAGFGCTHPEAIQAGLQSVAAAAAASSQQHQFQQQQQQLIVLYQQQHGEVLPNSWKANPDSAAGVWGVYGPPGEW